MIEISKDLRLYAEFADMVDNALRNGRIGIAKGIAEDSTIMHDLIGEKLHYKELIEVLSGRVRGFLNEQVRAVVSGANEFPKYDERRTPIADVTILMHADTGGIQDWDTIPAEYDLEFVEAK